MTRTTSPFLHDQLDCSRDFRGLCLHAPALRLRFWQRFFCTEWSAKGLAEGGDYFLGLFITLSLDLFTCQLAFVSLHCCILRFT